MRPAPVRPQPSGNRSLSAFDVLVVGAVCFALAGCLNARHLHRMAEDLPTSSSLRRPAMTVSGWLADLSGAFQLTRPGRAIDDRRPGGAGFTEAGTDVAVGATTTVADAGAPPETAAAGATEEPATEETATTTTVPDTPVETVPAGPKVPTKADKALVYIAGDSLAKDVASPLQGLVDGTGVARSAVRTEVGTASTGSRSSAPT
jgi:hypothetical protein